MRIGYIPVLEGSADDFCEAMTPQEVQERLKLSRLKERIWYVVPSCATTGEGLFEGLVSTGLSIGQWQSSDNGPGLAVKQCQDASTTTGQIGDSDIILRPSRAFDDLYVQHFPFRIPWISLFIAVARLLWSSSKRNMEL